MGRPWTRNNEHSDSFKMVDSFQMWLMTLEMGDKAMPSQMLLLRKLMNY
jgi:hypothetical protein